MNQMTELLTRNQGSQEAVHFINLTFKENNYQCSFLYQAKLCFRNKGEIKTFSEGKMTESSSNRSTLKNKSSSRKREMISVGNFQLQEWRKQNRNGRYLVNTVDHFSHISLEMWLMVEGKNYTIVWLGLKYIEITT